MEFAAVQFKMGIDGNVSAVGVAWQSDGVDAGYIWSDGVEQRKRTWRDNHTEKCCVDEASVQDQIITTRRAKPISVAEHFHMQRFMDEGLIDPCWFASRNVNYFRRRPHVNNVPFICFGFNFGETSVIMMQFGAYKYKCTAMRTQLRRNTICKSSFPPSMHAIPIKIGSCDPYISRLSRAADRFVLTRPAGPMWHYEPCIPICVLSPDMIPSWKRSPG